jgi:dienelactone hydrolase
MEPPMKTTFQLAGLAWILAAIAGLGACSPARAQQEFPPPQGKGRVVVVLSGQTGPQHYTAVSAAIAKLGYDAVLFDGNAMEGSQGAAVKTAIEQAQRMPHALPGKVGLVGFSLGGGMSLFYGTHLPDLVAGVVAWYPLTSPIHDAARFVAGLKVPVLMLAGEDDTYKDCCLIKTARGLEAAAKAAGAPLELVSYSSTRHDFVIDGAYFNAKSYSDAMQRTANRLKAYLGQ